MSELENMMQKVLSSPEDMSRIMELAQSLTGSVSSEAPAPSSGADSGKLDPELAGLVTRIMRGLSSSASTDKTALISALKPYLREERRAKIDRAMRIARIAKIAGGALGEMGGDTFGL